MAGTTDVMHRLRQAHTHAVLDELTRTGGLTRADLARRTGLSRTTLSTIVSGLLERGVVVERPDRSPAPRRRGRPVTKVSMNPAAGLFVGVDIAQTWTHVVVVNMAHEVVATERVATAMDAKLSQRTGQAIRLVDRTAADHGIELGNLEGIGLGVYGVVEDPMVPGSGTLTRQVRAAVARFERRYNVSVVAENTSRLAALAESTWGAATGAQDMIYVRWSSGVGGGVVVDGRLVRGAHGIAGQLGHVSVDPKGESCVGCGGRGCLNPRIRSSALLEAAAAQGLQLPDIDAFLDKARAADQVVRSVLATAAHDLGVGLAQLAVHLDPKRIVVGGEIAELGEVALEQVRESVRQFAFPAAPRRLELVPAMFGPEAAALGAVALLLDDRADSVDRLSRLRGVKH